MKAQLRKSARVMATWPIVGRWVRIAVAVIRLPEFRAGAMELHHRQHAFVTEQLPTLLQTVSDLQHRQLVTDNGRDNLVMSVPVALRKITRDLKELDARLASESKMLAQTFDRRLNETQERMVNEMQERMENLSRVHDRQLNETQERMENLSRTHDQRIGDTQKRLENVSESVGYLLGRVEFVRRELMYEMRYSETACARNNAAGECGKNLRTKIEILAPEKLENARNEQLRLNLGCGHIPLEGYLNVDRRALPGVDIVADVNELPFQREEIDEIFSAHLLEHFPEEQLRRQLLRYWIGLLKPGGTFGAVVPDAESMIRKYANGEYPYAHLREVTFGAQDYDGDFHFNMFTPQSLKALLEEAGLVDLRIIETGRQNGECLEFELTGRRKTSTEDARHG